MTTNATDPVPTFTTRFEDLVWHPVDPGNTTGPQIAQLWGNPTQGPFGALLRVPAGFESPIHSHTNEERVIQLRGRSIHWTRSESKARPPVMTPGDYMMMPAGVPHVSAATDEEDSIEFITMDGAFDFNIAEPIPEEK